jgi:addiction module HigA family antidote
MNDIGFPFCPVHPGEVLKDELEYRRISQKSFALRIGLPYSTLNEILNCKRPVTTDFALLVEAALGLEPTLLLRMQASYNMQVAKEDKKFTKRLNEIRKIASTLL